MCYYVWFKKRGRCTNQKRRRTCIIYPLLRTFNLAVGDTMKVCPVLKETIDNTYEMTKLVKMFQKRDAKLHSIQAENNSSGSNEDGEFVDGLKNPTIKLFCHTRWTVRTDYLSGVIKTLMSCKSCGIGRLKTVPVRRRKHASVASKCIHSNFLTALAYI